MEELRDHYWLEAKLDEIWQKHFADVAKLNYVRIEWGRAATARLGSLTGKGGINPRHKPANSIIRINKLLRNPEVPEAVVTQTIAHELAHYTHGFCSPHPQLYRYPHTGQVIEKELRKRNLGDDYDTAQAWLKAHWVSHVESKVIKPKRRTYARKRLSLLQNLSAQITGQNRLRRRPRRRI